MTKFELNLATALPLIRKAYEEKRLTAQGKAPQTKYRDKLGNPCAIGAAIPDDLAREIDADVYDGYGVGSLMNQPDKPFITPEEDRERLQSIQSLHDSWVRARGSANFYVKSAEAAFKKEIYRE